MKKAILLAGLFFLPCEFSTLNAMWVLSDVAAQASLNQAENMWKTGYQAEALPYYISAANQNYDPKVRAQAAFKLGTIYYRGISDLIERDTVKALEYLRQAVSSDDVTESDKIAAALKLGVLLYEEGDVAINKNRSFGYLQSVSESELAQDRERAKAYYYLYFHYVHGHGTEQDEVQAREMLRKALGLVSQESSLYPTIQYKLAHLYTRGAGGAHEFEAAARLLEQAINHPKAVDSTTIKAAMILGRLYATGQGVPYDRSKARCYFRIVHDQSIDEKLKGQAQLWLDRMSAQ